MISTFTDEEILQYITQLVNPDYLTAATLELVNNASSYNSIDIASCNKPIVWRDNANTASKFLTQNSKRIQPITA